MITKQHKLECWIIGTSNSEKTHPPTTSYLGQEQLLSEFITGKGFKSTIFPLAAAKFTKEDAEWFVNSAENLKVYKLVISGEVITEIEK